MRILSQLPALLSVVAILVLAGIPVASAAGEISFAAVLAVKSQASAASEREIARTLQQRARRMEFALEIEPGADVDQQLTVRLTAPSKVRARDRINRLIQRPRLELRLLHPENDRLAPLVQRGDHDEPDHTLLDYGETDDDGLTTTRPVLVSRTDVLVASDHLKNASVDAARAGILNVSLTAKGGTLMRKLTEPMTKGHDRLAIILNDRVLSTPTVQDTLSTNFIITGLTDNRERKALAAAFRNALGAPLELVSLEPVAQPTR